MMDRSPELRELNKKVTAAIYRAEHLPPGWEAQVAFREVSAIEEEIARRTAPDSLQGSIARRGVITAALSGGDWLRALSLAEAYLAEPAPAELAGELAALRDEATDGLSKAEVPGVQMVATLLRDQIARAKIWCAPCGMANVRRIEAVCRVLVRGDGVKADWPVCRDCLKVRIANPLPDDVGLEPVKQPEWCATAETLLTLLASQGTIGSIA